MNFAISVTKYVRSRLLTVKLIKLYRCDREEISTHVDDIGHAWSHVCQILSQTLKWHINVRTIMRYNIIVGNFVYLFHTYAVWILEWISYNWLYKCKQVENRMTNKGVKPRTTPFRLETCVHECLWITQSKQIDIAITKSVITHFRVFCLSKWCCLASKSLKEDITFRK